MVSLQIINKIIQNKNIDIITANGLDSSYFLGYENEVDFILSHYKKYGVVPDRETFLEAFQDFDLIEVNEPDNYLIDKLIDEYNFQKAAVLLNNGKDKLKADTVSGIEYLSSNLKGILEKLSINTPSIGDNVQERFQLYQDKVNSDRTPYITTGFQELDSMISGWNFGEEYGVIVGRTGQGKSWVLLKCLTHAWQLGYNVGMVSPEMSVTKIGYRVDTILHGISNSALNKGDPTVLKDYHEFIGSFYKDKPNKFYVSTVQDFSNSVTVSKLRTFVNTNNIQILGIDGLSYLKDERGKTTDNKTTTLTNISEDLMQLSVELKIPILVVVQSNREGLKDNDSPGLENIRDSDGIAQNATKVLSIRQNNGALEISVKKNRDGFSNGTVAYLWDADKGIFQYIPSASDGVNPQMREERIDELEEGNHPF